eukprot:2543593-Lingulodinium_polyedra.AAC.1
MGRFGELVDFDVGASTIPGVIPGVSWVSRVQFYARESARMCVESWGGHILDPNIPYVVTCIFDADDMR